MRSALAAVTALLSAGLLLAACGGGDAVDPSGGPEAGGATVAEPASADGESDEAPAGAAAEAPAAPAAEPAVDPPPARGAGVTDAYRSALEAVAVAAALGAELGSIGAGVQAAGTAAGAFAALEAALPRLVAALRAAVGELAGVDAPEGVERDHELLIAGLESIIALEEELIVRVGLGDAAGALARTRAIAAQQAALSASLSAEVRDAAGALLGVAGALGFLPLAAEQLAPDTAEAVGKADAESYLARLDFPGATRLLSLEPLIVGETVLITAQWSVPASVAVGDLLGHYEAALRSLGALGPSQRLQSDIDGSVTVGVEHPFGSAIVLLGGAEDGSHLVSVTGSFPSGE